MVHGVLFIIFGIPSIVPHCSDFGGQQAGDGNLFPAAPS